MDQKAVYKYCKELGCCEACCLRYMGIKNSNAYGNITNFIVKFQDLTTTESDTKNCLNERDTEMKDNSSDDDINSNMNIESDSNSVVDSAKEIKNTNSENDNNLNIISDSQNEETDNKQSVVKVENNITIDSINKDTISNGDTSPPAKKRRLNVCASCLGVLQDDTWQEAFVMVKDMLDKKGYDCNSFACALSAPIATLLRERAITLRLTEAVPKYDYTTLTALKEAWKWSFGIKLADYVKKTLDSGSISPLLVTVSMDYVDDLQELEILKQVSPQLFEERSKQKRRFVTEFTRRSVEQALENATLQSMTAAGGGLPVAGTRAHCVSVLCAHEPMYLAGRYIKLSRNLPQSPWILEGRRVLPSSVQEIIFKPLAKIYKFDEEDADRRLKFIAAGREDVDVRCLGDGRPFAVEITDPSRQLTAEELSTACEEISRSGEVIVKQIVTCSKDDLIQLKKGEETKSKSYEALCIKLSHSKYDEVPPESPIAMSPADITRVNSFRNTPEGDAVRVRIQQKTPIRVLHRRPLLTREREILDLEASLVPDHPQLFIVRIRTSAGTYVKEWVHGELSRSRPSLADALSCRLDLLALDVTAVHLNWPIVK